MGALIVVCLIALPAMLRVAAKPGMTVKIPARQDVDNVYVLAAIHQKHCTLQVSGTVHGPPVQGRSGSKITIHLTNQAGSEALEQREAVREEGSAQRAGP